MAVRFRMWSFRDDFDIAALAHVVQKQIERLLEGVPVVPPRRLCWRLLTLSILMISNLYLLDFFMQFARRLMHFFERTRVLFILFAALVLIIYLAQ